MSGKPRFGVMGAAALLAATILASGVLARDRDEDHRCDGSRDVRLVNGKIHTMDARNSIVSSVTIKRGRFDEIGRGGDFDDSGCVKTIDVHGRTAIPGLVDNHNLFVLLSIRPGHDTRLETATSIADVQAALHARGRRVGGAWGDVLAAVASASPRHGQGRLQWR